METELLRDDTIHSRSASMNYSKIVSSQEIINILGSASIANFIYIPEQNICFSVNDLCDADSNKIRLSDALGSEDATAIAAASRNYAS